MFASPPSAARLRSGWLAVLLLAALPVVSCKKKPETKAAPAAEEDQDPQAPEVSADAPFAKPPPEPARCREVRSGSLFSVGDTQPARTPLDDEEQDPIALPFAVELGGVVGFGDGFAVGVLESRKRGQQASVALLSADGSGRSVDLGSVHGDIEAPELARLGERLVVAFGNSDAGGATLHTATLEPKADKALPGPELLGIDRDAGVALGASADEALLAFSRLEKGKEGLRLARFRPGQGSAFLGETSVPGARDPESPRLVARPGGHWLAWVEQHPKSAERKSQRDAGEEEPGGLELGPRSLRIVTLDGAGRPLAPALTLSKPGSYVLAFELAAWPDGGAVLAFRDDPTAPGVEGGVLHLAHVRADGSVETGELEDPELGAGTPALLFDPSPRSPGSVVWVAAGGGSETTRFGLLTGSGTSLTPLVSDKMLSSAELVGVHAGRLLAARPRGTSRDLLLVECDAAAR